MDKTEPRGAASESSEAPPLSPESTTTSAETAEEASARAQEQKRSRDLGALCLGGYRAADQYRAERFEVSAPTSAAYEAASTFDARQGNLYLFGPCGSGKSHLAIVAARRSFARPGVDWPNRVRSLTPMALSRGLRACPDAAREEEYLRDLIRREALVLEDLGVGKDTDFSVATLYELINGRYQNNPTGLVVTSNLALGELAEKLGDDRVASRLAQMCRVVSLRGVPDRRIPAKRS